MSQTIYIWQGFRHRWLNHPHRVGALASFCDPANGHVTHGFFPGIDGDNGVLETGVTALEVAALGVTAECVELRLGGLDTWDEGRGRAREAHWTGHDARPLPALAPGTEAHAVLAGFGWFPTDAASLAPADRAPFITEGLARVWPTRMRVDVGLDAAAAGGGLTLTASASLTHADSADWLKRPRPGPLWHEVRVAVLVLRGPVGALAAERCDCSLRREKTTPEGPARGVVTQVRRAGEGTILGIQGFGFKLAESSRPPRGRYLHELACWVGPRGTPSEKELAWDVRFGVRGNGNWLRRLSHLTDADAQLLAVRTRGAVVRADAVREAIRVTTGLARLTAPCPPRGPFHRIGRAAPLVFRQGEPVTDLRGSSLR